MADWMKRRLVNQREAARILEMDHTFLNQILSGRRVPGLPNAIQIERVTGIPVESWLPTVEDNSHANAGDKPQSAQAGKA